MKCLRCMNQQYLLVLRFRGVLTALIFTSCPTKENNEKRRNNSITDVLTITFNPELFRNCFLIFSQM